jgi:pectate lyase
MLMNGSVRCAFEVVCALAACVGVAACGSDDVNEPAPAPAPGAGAVAPSSLGADGFATVGTDGKPFTVTGGAAADAAHTYTVRNRAELVAALFGKANADPALDTPDNTPKIILIQGTIDLNADADNKSTSPDVDLKACTNTFTSAGAFYAQYKVAFDPNLWLKQNLDVDNKPPALPLTNADGSTSLEGIRLCAQLRQTARIIMRVGSNTSILGLGADARIVHGTLRIGDFQPLRNPPIVGEQVLDANGRPLLEQERAATNVVIRNITFEDAYDDWPSWDPKDSFSIAAADFGVGKCSTVFNAVADTGPHQCPSRKGGRWNSEYDSIAVINGSNIWIDHNSFSDGVRTDDKDPPVPEWALPFNGPAFKIQHHDGAVDITLAATRVTLSFNRVVNHDKTHLVGGTDAAARFVITRNGVTKEVGAGPDQLFITMHHNFYENVTQRMPRGRFGRFHVFNNVLKGQVDPVDPKVAGPVYPWLQGYAIGTATKMFVESNVFDIRAGAAGDALPSAAKLTFGDGLLSTAANQAKCVKAGYAEVDCATYFFESNTLLNGTLVPPGSTLAAAQAKGGGNNAVINLLDEKYWVPRQDYAYTPTDVNAVRALVEAQAGAGKAK